MLNQRTPNNEGRITVQFNKTTGVEKKENMLFLFVVKQLNPNL